MLAGERLRRVEGGRLVGDVSGGEQRVGALGHTRGGAQFPRAERTSHERGPGVGGESVEQQRIHPVTVAGTSCSS
nr:hypothetical protein [Rathayibacter rathayi]